MTSYLALVRRDGAGVPWAAAVLSRVVLGMSVVAVVLLVRRSGFGYDRAGFTSAVMSLGVAAATPWWGRFADRRGPSRLLLVLGGAYALSAIVLAWTVTAGLPAVVTYVAAAVLGGTFPPVSAVARVGWRRLYGLELRDRAFSLDSVTTEVGFVAGPVLAAGLVDLVVPWLGVVVAGVVMAVATVLFARSDLIQAIPGSAATGRGGALQVPAIRVLMVVFALVGVAFGTLDILAPAVAEANGRPALAGVVLGVFAFGSAVGGLVYGSRRWPSTPRRRLAALLVTMAVAMVAITQVVEVLAAFAAIALMSGVVIAPSVVIIFSLADDTAPAPVLTEALSWLLTAVTGGAALGAAISGRVIEQAGLVQAGLVAASMLAMGSVVVAMSRRTLVTPHPS